MKTDPDNKILDILDTNLRYSSLFNYSLDGTKWNVRARHRKNWESWKCWDVLISLHPSVWMQYSQRSTHSLVLGSLKECCVLPHSGPNVWMGDLAFAHGLQHCERRCLVDGLNGCIYTREGTYQLHPLPSGPQFVGKFCGSYPAQAPCMGNLLICSQH